MTRSLFIATPMYGAQCYGEFAGSRESLLGPLAQRGIAVRAKGIADSLVTRARNNLAAEFMNGDMTDLLFIDADVSFAVPDVMDLLAHPDKDVICGAYPKKEINWTLVREAVKLGFADEDPSILENFTSRFFFHPADPELPHQIGHAMEVTETGTGFMLIRRHVLEAFAEAYPELTYYPGDGEPNYGGKIACFFDTAIVGDRYLSEDQNFCRLVRAIGLKVWVLPHIQLTHLGYYRFVGDVGAIAAVQETATRKGTE